VGNVHELRGAGKGRQVELVLFFKGPGGDETSIFCSRVGKGVGVEWELTAGGSDLQGSGAFPESGERMLSGLSGR